MKLSGNDYEKIFYTPRGKIVLSSEKNVILRLLGASPSGVMLDLGTGTGRIARYIAMETGMTVIGINANRQRIDTTRVKAKKILGPNSNKYVLMVGEGQHVPFVNNSFDSVVCVRVLKYFPNYAIEISEVSRVLKAGGVLTKRFGDF